MIITVRPFKDSATGFFKGTDYFISFRQISFSMKYLGRRFTSL